MEYFSVVIAAIAAFAFGAIWYKIMTKHWIKAANVPEEQVKNLGAMPFIIGLVGTILVAGMMRHIFASSGIEGACKGLLSGLGIGLFIVVPWLATNYAFAGRSAKLTIIDGIYAVAGCGIIGLVLNLL